MKTYIKILFLLLLLPIGLMAQQNRVRNKYSPTFIENQGQWEHDFDFYYQKNNQSIFFEKKGWTILHTDNEDLHHYRDAFHLNKHNLKSISVKKHCLKIRLINCRNINPIGIKKAYGIYNYFLGNNPRKWRTKVPAYQEIIYYNIYPKINLIWKGNDNGIKYDYIIKKGGNIEQIKVQYNGVSKVFLRDNKLIIPLSTGKIVEWIPSAYQIINKDTFTVNVHFEVNENIVSFKTGAYNKNYDLVIDPKLIFSTYSGSKGDNFGYTATYDNDGNMYSGGIVDIDRGIYPVTTGAFQTKYGGGVGVAPVNLKSDVSISKYSSDGSTLIYATYLGGSDDENPHSLVADAIGNLYIFGTTRSKNFPLDTNGYDTSHNGRYDLFVVKISADGSKLLGGTYLGGKKDDGINSGNLRYNYSDDFRGDIFVSNNNNVYVATCTRSADFPTNKAFQPKFKGKKDAVIFSLNSNLTQLKWSTFYGTSGEDAAYSIKQNDSFLYIGGGTDSAGLDSITHTYQTKYKSEREGFVLKLLEKDSVTPVAMTYFGTPKYDQIFFLDLDADGRVYIAGQTEGTIPKTTGTYGKNNTKQFIAAFGSNLDTLVFSTTFGFRETNPELSPSAFMVDNCNNIYYSGWGSFIGRGLNAGTTAGLEVSADAIRKTTDSNDFYLLVLSPFAKSMLHATYFGGTETGDHVDGGTSRFDKGGIVYQSVCASCPDIPGNTTNDFPTTKGVAFEKNVSYRCSNACFKIDFNITYAVSSRFTAPTEGCVPFTVDFINKTPKAKTYLWDFGDGTTSTDFEPKHTFIKPGIYTINLTVSDPNSCNKTHKQTLKITVLEKPAANIKIEREPCSQEYKIKIEDYNKKLNYKLNVAGISYKNKEEVIYKAKLGETFNINLEVEIINSKCKSQTTKTITLDSSLIGGTYLYNVFTPGTDGLNDCFELRVRAQNCEIIPYKIYNRWNQLVFKSSDKNPCWNGKMFNTGNKLPTGTYYYIATNKDGTTINGSVTLINE